VDPTVGPAHDGAIPEREERAVGDGVTREAGSGRRRGIPPRPYQAPATGARRRQTGLLSVVVGRPPQAPPPDADPMPRAPSSGPKSR
jgi:hypothetical protein